MASNDYSAPENSSSPANSPISPAGTGSSPSWNQCARKSWVVYAKAPFRGPDHLLQYLARYPHRVAISNHRLLSFDGESVTFRWKDYAHGNKKRKSHAHPSVQRRPPT